jgi:molecular chaperone Hsp33
MENSSRDDEGGIEVRTYFVRGRNALVARGEFSDLYVDFYLHLAGIESQPDPLIGDMFKETLKALTLHCASRPRTESVAWTIHFEDPLLNLFLAGNNTLGTVIGSIHTENVKQGAENLFFADTVHGNQDPRRSVVSFEGASPFSAVEEFYRRSEQRLARILRLDDEEFVMITGQPDADTEWINALTSEDVLVLDSREELSLLETRRYCWACGCDEKRILNLLRPTMQSDPDALFEGEEVVRVSCPRCGTRYAVTRETLEAYVASET